MLDTNKVFLHGHTHVAFLFAKYSIALDHIYSFAKSDIFQYALSHNTCSLSTADWFTEQIDGIPGHNRVGGWC